MAAGKSGLSLGKADIPLVLGMVARGDRKHDIAAWFGVNQGRIAEAEDGKYGAPPATPGEQLPPKGPPGLKGRRLRAAVQEALGRLGSGDVAGAKAALEAGEKEYDADEI